MSSDPNFDLFLAVKRGSNKDIKQALKEGAAINYVNHTSGDFALLLAARHDLIAVAKLLTQRGANVNLQNKEGTSALMESASYNGLRVMEFILKKGAEINLQNNGGLNAIMIACKEGQSVKTAKFLLESGAQVNTKSNDGQSALLYACCGTSTEKAEYIRELIKHGADVNMQDRAGWSPLMRACENFESDSVKILLESGADVNLGNNDGKTALMMACTSGSVETTRLLLDSGSQVNVSDKTGHSALILACCSTSPEQADHVSALLEHGAEVNMQDERGWSALMRACESGTYGIIQSLLTNGADTNLQNKEGSTALMVAKSEVFKHDILLLIESVDINLQDFQGRSALMRACEIGSYSIVEQLINHGANVNLRDSKGQTALMKAQDIRITKLLLGSGAEVNIQDNDGWSSLMRACEKWGEWTVQDLLSANADVNLKTNKGFTALMISSSRGYSVIIKHLLNRGAEVDSTDNEGGSALMHSLRSKGMYYYVKSSVALLLQHGASVNLQDNEGKSALILAGENEQLSSFEDLTLLNGADLDLQDSDGWSALMKACETRGKLKVRELLSANADANLKTKRGLSALMIACWKGFDDIVALLLQHGVEVDSTDNEGRSALLYASEHGHANIVQLLIQHGASIDIQDYRGYSALMKTCEKGHLEQSSILMDSEADVYLKNTDGKSALDLAIDNDTLTLFTKILTDPSLPGILFLENGKKGKVASEPKTINLEEVGITVSIPEDALPSTDPPLDIQVRPCFSGPFEVPEDLELVSPVYIVKPSREVKFRKRVLVKIWHHANLETEEDCEDMVFLSASTTPEYRGTRPVYVFREIRGVKGLFRPGEEQPVGEIALKHFCCMGVGKRKRKNDGEGSTKKRSKGNLYSVRLYRVMDGRIILCVCLYQPHYTRTCNKVIARQYGLMANIHPTSLNGVTIVKNEVCIKKSGADGWAILFDKEPATISKDEINCQEIYEIEDLIDMDYPPRIVLLVRKTPQTLDSEPLYLHIEGLNKDANFVLQPGDFLIMDTTPIQYQVMASQSISKDTLEMKYAIRELREEIQLQLHTSNSQSTSSDNTSLIHISTQMLILMENIEKIIHDRKSIATVVAELNIMEMRSQQLRHEAKQICDKLKVKYGMDIHAEKTNTLAVQLKKIYLANKMHSTTSEWEAAISVFVVNAANLMKSIRIMLASLKFAQEIPNNFVTPLTPATPTVRPQHQLQTAKPGALSDESQLSSHQHFSFIMQAQQFPPVLPAETATAQLECAATSALSPAKLPQSPGFKVQSPHQPLCIQDTKEVRHCLDSLTAQWEYIALELDISPDTIDIIKANHQDIRARLLEVIKVWLRQTTPPPTWQALADAVQYIDSNKAQEIRHKIS